MRHNVPVHLPPKEQAVLELLLTLRGGIASHELIEDKVWPRQVVSYASMARCIYSLRLLLGHRGKALIETVPKRGYRLAVEIRQPAQGKPKARERSIETETLAYSHYLAGLQHANRGGLEDLSHAVDRFQAAARVDPGYAMAYSAIADVRMYQILKGYLSPSKGLRLGLEAASRALELDPLLVPALSIRGWFLGMVERRLTKGLELLAEAQSLDPEYSRLYAYRAWLLRAAGRAEEALEVTGEAIGLDPINLLNRHAHTWSLFVVGRAAEALAMEQELVGEFGDDAAAHAYCSVFSAYLGRHELALHHSERSMALSPESPIIWAASAYALVRAGRHSEAAALAGRAERQQSPHCPPAWLAPVHVALGDEAKAFELLERGLADRCPWTLTARLDPRQSHLFAAIEVDSLFIP